MASIWICSQNHHVWHNLVIILFQKWRNLTIVAKKWYIRNWMLQFKIYESTHKTTMFGIKNYLPKMAETSTLFPIVAKVAHRDRRGMRRSTNGMRIEREETETESVRDVTSKWSTNKRNRNRAQTEWGERDGAGTEWGKEWKNPHDNSILTLYMTMLQFWVHSKCAKV